VKKNGDLLGLDHQKMATEWGFHPRKHETWVIDFGAAKTGASWHFH
jgi:hypothetical protein